MKTKRFPGKSVGRFQQRKVLPKKFNFKKENEEKELENIKEACKKIDPDKIQLFQDFPLSTKTLEGLKNNEYLQPTEIQRESLFFSLQGLDVLGAAKTGSGKTLAFVIPILEVLYLKRWVKSDGLGALVITPTRELAYQIFETLKNIGRYHDFSAGLVIGGKDLHFEKNRMNSCNIVICTPGRLLQHMDENPLFTCDNLQILVLDEADRCLDMGFEKTMNSIIENLPVSRQTLLFSATQTKSVRDLARLSLKDPMYVSVHEHAKHSTPEGLRQSYIVCELHEKIDMLWSFLRNHKNQKILVFLSSCQQVKYHYDMFCRLRPGISLLSLYGTLHQLRRMAIYDDFCKRKRAVLFATDIAARGLDFPEVNWVLQIDCPEDANTYIHRAGRTARYQKGGESLLVLIPSEEDAMVEQLKAKKIPISKIKVNPKKLQSPLRKMQSCLAANPELKATAQRAFVSYLKSVYFMKNKNVFDIQALDTDAYAMSLGLAVTPRIRFLKKAEKLRNEKMNKSLKQDTYKSVQSNVNAPEDHARDLFLHGAREVNDESVDEEDTKINQINQSHKMNLFSNVVNDSEDDGDLFQLKRKDHDLDEEIVSHEVPKETQNKEKILTKVAVAKRILKKKIIANKRTTFNEDGEVVFNATREKVSGLAREYEIEETGGINIEKAKLVLQEEDKFDKQIFREKVKAKHREKKLKLKGKNKDKNDEEDHEDPQSEEESGSEPDLSWLPDPDKIYGPKEDSDDEDIDNKHLDEGKTIDDEDISENSSYESPYNNFNNRIGDKIKRKRIEKLNQSKILKKRKVRDTEYTDEQIELMADEELALHFLKNV